MSGKMLLVGSMILSIVFVTMAAAQAPKSPAEIPIYSGATLVEGKEADYKKYEVRKAPEDVVAICSLRGGKGDYNENPTV